MYKFLCEHIFLGNIPDYRNVGLYGNSVFNTLRNCQRVFQNGCTINSQQKCTVFLIFFLFDALYYLPQYRPPRVCELVSYLVFIFISPMANGIKYLFICTRISSLKKCIGIFFAEFLIVLSFFLQFFLILYLFILFIYL